MREITLHNTEDKSWWVKEYGPDFEARYCKYLERNCGVSACLNPEKDRDPYVVDLLVDGKLADLKAQRTPFMTAGRYGYNPSSTVTFNDKDYYRYKEQYPQIDIYWWVEWVKPKGWDYIEIKPTRGAWVIPFVEVAKMIESGAPKHEYKRRINDTMGNGKSSYLLSLAKFQRIA